MSQVDPHSQGFLRTEELVKRFDDVVAVDEVSISIQKGEIFALLGSYGCGKSTLLRLMAGFEKPTSGKVFLDGVDILDGTPLLDIKPYCAKFDCIPQTRNGWQDEVDEATAEQLGRREYRPNR